MSDTSEQGHLENEGLAEQTHIDEPMTAIDRLRAFEDEHLGAEAPRISGKVERGHGSLFVRMPAEKRKAHEAIEKVADTERKLNEARAAVAVAENEHIAAVAAADEATSHLGD